MARRQTELSDSKVATCVLAAMRRLHARGYALMGPKVIGDEAEADYGRPIAPTLASHYLRRLEAAGEVARHAQGIRRGFYRLKHMATPTARPEGGNPA